MAHHIYVAGQVHAWRLACLLAGLAAPGLSYADWWQECTAEREKFCRDVPAGGGRVAACIDQHEGELSPRCKASRPASSASGGPSTPNVTQGGNTDLSDAGGQGYRTVYQTNFQSEIDRGLMLQQPTPTSISMGAAPCQPSQPALRVSIRKTDDYSRVANGVPRAEISFAGRFNFEPGHEYVMCWSTCLPPDFQFDSQQPEGIGQIHEGAAQGSPPWGMSLVGGRYEVQLRDGARVTSHDIGSAAGDRGRWVRWSLRYRPASNGAGAVMELDKDGARALTANGVPNAYPNDNHSYLKLGIYKWWWKDRPSDVQERTMFFGNVSVTRK